MFLMSIEPHSQEKGQFVLSKMSLKIISYMIWWSVLHDTKLSGSHAFWVNNIDYYLVRKYPPTWFRLNSDLSSSNLLRNFLGVLESTISTAPPLTRSCVGVAFLTMEKRMVQVQVHLEYRSRCPELQSSDQILMWKGAFFTAWKDIKSFRGWWCFHEYGNFTLDRHMSVSQPVS